MLVSSRTGELLLDPEITSRGFVYIRDSENLLSQIAALAKSTMAERSDDFSNRFKGVDINAKRLSVRDTVRTFIFEKTKRNPMILPVIIEVDPDEIVSGRYDFG